MRKVVIGIVDTPRQAEIARERLGSMGIAPEDVSVVYPDRQGAHDSGVERGTKASEGALTGAAIGAVVGVALGILVGVGVIVLPPAASLVSAGPVLAALAAAAAIGTLLAIVGALFGSSIPEIEAKHHQSDLGKRGILVAVNVHGRAEMRLARDVLDTVASNVTTARKDAAPSHA